MALYRSRFTWGRKEVPDVSLRETGLLIMPAGTEQVSEVHCFRDTGLFHAGKGRVLIGKGFTVLHKPCRHPEVGPV